MRRFLFRGFQVCVTAVLALAASSVQAQPPDPAPVQVPRVPWFLPLQGPGSQIGVSARELTLSEQRIGGSRNQDPPNVLTTPPGVVIDQVDPWSPASRAGLKKGDIVTSFDRHPVRNVAHFSRLVAETPPGWTVPITILRDGKARALSITPTL